MTVRKLAQDGACGREISMVRATLSVQLCLIDDNDRAALRAQFMAELAAQVRMSECSNRETWCENERVCGIESCHILARSRN